MKKLLIITFLTAFVSISYSQVNSISGSGTNKMNSVIEYSVIRDAPEYANNIIISLYPLYFNYYQSLITLGPAGELHYNLKNIVTLNVLLKKALIELPHNIPEPDLYDLSPAGNRSKMTHIDLSLDFTFLKNFSDKKKMLWGGKLNFKQMFSFGIRAGYQYISNPYRPSDYNCSGYNISDPLKAEKTLSGGSHNMLMYYSHIISFGLSAKRTANFSIQIKDKEKKNNHKRLDEAYIDIFFDPSMKFGDINRIDSMVNGTYIPAEHTYHITSGDKTKWGFRVGCMFYPLAIAGSCYGLEAGILPGPTGGSTKNAYILVRIGVGFSANLFNRP